MVSDKLLATVISVVPMLVGLGMIYRGYTSRKLADTMAEIDPTPIGNLQPGDGLVEIEGRARAEAERSAAPMLDTEGVAVTTSVERRDIRDAPGDQPGQRTVWNTVHSDRTVHDFSVEDDTGRVPVDIPSDGELNIAIQTTTVGKNDTPPAHVQSLIDATEGLDADPLNVRRYSQGVIEDGESVYGLGEPTTGADGQLVFTGDGRASEFILSDLSEEQLAEQKAGGGLGGYLLGGLFFVVGAGVMLLVWLG